MKALNNFLMTHHAHVITKVIFFPPITWVKLCFFSSYDLTMNLTNTNLYCNEIDRFFCEI